MRYWEAWNEPNAGSDLAPQRINGRPASPAHYRKMVNAFAGAVHAAAPGNYVVAGTLGPFAHNSKDIQVVSPMRFMSDLLCVSIQAPHRKTCSARTQLDIWSHNPYTNGGPTWHAKIPGDVSIGELPEMHALLMAAKRQGTIVSRSQPQFWVTEFSWDTNPPDPKGVPMKLHARWVSEALFRMWKAGVSAVIWFRLQDDPLRVSPYQSGFFTASGHAKYSLEAFRFPFVAFDERERGLDLGPDTVRQARRGDRGAKNREYLGQGRAPPFRRLRPLLGPTRGSAPRHDRLPSAARLLRGAVDPVLAHRSAAAPGLPLRLRRNHPLRVSPERLPGRLSRHARS